MKAAKACYRKTAIWKPASQPSQHLPRFWSSVNVQIWLVHSGHKRACLLLLTLSSSGANRYLRLAMQSLCKSFLEVPASHYWPALSSQVRLDRRWRIRSTHIVCLPPSQKPLLKVGYKRQNDITWSACWWIDPCRKSSLTSKAPEANTALGQPGVKSDTSIILPHKHMDSLA